VYFTGQMGDRLPCARVRTSGERKKNRVAHLLLVLLRLGEEGHIETTTEEEENYRDIGQPEGSEP